MSNDDQGDDSRMVDVQVEVHEVEGTEDITVFTFDVGNGEQSFCVIDFVDLEDTTYAIATPEDQYMDDESPVWDVFVFEYEVVGEDSIVLTPIEDEALRERVILEYDRLNFLEEMVSDPEMNPYNPKVVDE